MIQSFAILFYIHTLRPHMSYSMFSIDFKLQLYRLNCPNKSPTHLITQKVLTLSLLRQMPAVTLNTDECDYNECLYPGAKLWVYFRLYRVLRSCFKFCFIDFIRNIINKSVLKSEKSLSKFKGEQKSKTQRYQVDVQIDYVNWEQSYICGVLNIIGLTDHDPEIKTFFNGEIIGPDFSFLTRKWEADYKKDLEHWG